MSRTSPDVEVRSGIGDPVQLSDLHPVACASLARVDNTHDGGYSEPPAVAGIRIRVLTHHRKPSSMSCN
jgi:hypothetical protein